MLDPISILGLSRERASSHLVSSGADVRNSKLISRTKNLGHKHHYRAVKFPLRSSGLAAMAGCTRSGQLAEADPSLRLFYGRN